MTAPILGIDLGTTNSLCAVFEDGKPRLVSNSVGDYLTPSVVGVLEDGSIVVGAAARELRVTRPERCASCFKRLMGTDQTIELPGHRFSAVDLSSLVLASLRDDAQKEIDGRVTDAVITVPAYFNDAQRRATRQAGELAGLHVRRVVNEPTAAALMYGFHDRQAEKTLLVIDLGGGTFDVTLMEVFEGTLEIISTAGESMLGGEDFTDRLVAELLKTQGLRLETAELQRPLQVARLRQQCEAAKRELASAEQARVALPDESGLVADDAKTVRIDRKAFAKAVRPLLDRLAVSINRALRDGRHEATQVDDVILVGGATRMPALRDHVAQLLGHEPQCEHDPDQVVCLGAAVQAALIADDRAVDDMVMTDVCPYTLGIETVKELGGQVRDGYFTPILHRNTTIPVSREEPFATVAPNQREMRIKVFQGDHRKVEQNLLLGELEVTGIPAGPPGQTVYIRFSYDLNGILEVEAYPAGSDQKFRTVLTQHSSDLSEEEQREALARLQALKYYPREDMAKQRLLRLSERVVGEVSPFQRDALEQAIDGFEAALNSSDRELVEGAEQALLQVLSMLGIDPPSEEAADG
ncbi:Chaperone protein HscC [Pseudobythopirellula maris]|uniref:Chaperone protein HscC n=1 Tax=Pseudobythopirellula maris TaxID=2527991 RepID=A0A5C5ZPP8_9BACT|nr:Hsp70 family protein [Pseudobythopirellula maris]TWT89105.1 Chaperone protein HscC [Pseudobythopirellula maris]